MRQGTVTMEGRTPIGSRYMVLAKIQDRLGCDCIVKGRLPIVLIKTVRPFLHSWSPQKSIMQWGISFLKSLLSVTHKQWLFQNADIHNRFDEITMHQHTLLHQ
jgi:hypothetical protein